MSTIVTRAGKGSPLTWNEADNNFTNLNTDKLQSGNTAAALTITSATISGGALNGSLGATTPSTAVVTSLTDSGLTSGRITYASTGGLLADSANLVWDNTNARLGVGTGTPLKQFQVKSPNTTAESIALIGNGNTQYGFEFKTDGNLLWSLNVSGSRNLGFQTNDVERMRIDSSGNVGIGTSSPTDTISFGRIIDVSSSSLAGGTYYRNSGTGYFGAVGYDGTYGYLGTWGASAGAVRFYTNSTEKMRIDSSGNLGLGVTPSAYSAETKAIDIGAYGVSIANTAGYQATYVNNGYYNAGWKYKATGYQSANYTQSSGGHSWHTAPSGTAGTAITFTQAMTLDNSGNLGLGVTPSAWSASYDALEFSYGALSNVSTSVALWGNAYWNGTNSIYKTTAAATNYAQVAGSHTWSTAPSGTAGTAITFTERMRIDSSGNLGLGVTPSAWYTASGTKALQIGNRASIFSFSSTTTDLANNIYQSAAGDYSYLQTAYASFYRQNTGQHIWYTAPSGTAGNAVTFTQAMTLDASGNLLVGTTSASASSGEGIKLLAGASSNNICVVQSGSTSATDAYHLYSTGAGAYRFYVDMGGTVHATSIVISAISDERLKENIKDIDTGLNAVLSLKPRRFDWKDGKGQNKKNAAGFIAQEFAEVFKDSVSTSLAGDDGIEYLTMSHEELIPSLVKAIQEQQAMIDELKAKVAALEAA